MTSKRNHRSFLETAKEKIISIRYAIYLIGLGIWFGLSFLLPYLVGVPLKSPLVILSSPLAIAVVLLSLNCVSVATRRNEDEPSPSNKKQYDDEAARIRTIQDYGTAIITAASVVAAITGLKSQPLFLAYLAASLTSAIVALVPIWMSQTDWRSLSLLRHVKTVLLTFAVAWLAQAIWVLLSGTPV